jgi:hypothetical protein
MNRWVVGGKFSWRFLRKAYRLEKPGFGVKAIESPLESAPLGVKTRFHALRAGETGFWC